MIRGIGTDLVLVERIEQALQRHGERFARRILHDSEYQRFVTHRQPARYLAKRFAAKEAAFKALGTGMADGLSWQQLRVLNDARGAPLLELSGRAAELLQAGGGGRLLLSLTDERDHAMAFVVWSLA